MRNIDKIRKLKTKKLAKLFNYQYAEACDMCGYNKICDACNKEDGKPCDCNEGCLIWLKQPYNKNEKPWSVYNE